VCWHCQHPQWKRKCLGPGGTQDDAHKDFLERTLRRTSRAKSADAIMDDNVSVREKGTSARSTTKMKASKSVAGQTFRLSATSTVVPVHTAGKKRSIVEMLQGPSCREETKPAKHVRGVPSSTLLSVPIEPTHFQTKSIHQSGLQGHYATLGLEPGTSLEEVRKAYRRRSLVTHPDKGGNASEFQEVGEAFHVLSDAMKRTNCNSGRDASAMPERESPDNEVSAVHSVCVAMLALPRSSWHGLLVGLRPEVLKACFTMLKEGTDAVGEALGPDEDGEQIGVGSTGCGSSGGGVCGKAGKYSVKLGWRHFYVKTGRPVRSLDRALDIHVCLSQMRNTAVLRYEDRARDLRKAERGQDQSLINVTDGCCPPLLPCELHEMLLMLQDPFMHFVFAFDLTKKPRMMSPWVPRLDAAQHYHDLICRVQARKYKPLSLASDPKNEITNLMQQQAAQEREARKALERDMAAVVAAEVARRQCEPPPMPSGAHMQCDALALGSPAQLALLDECREAMIATKHSTEALQEELRKRVAADNVRHAQESRLRDDYLRERDDRRRVEEIVEGLLQQLHLERDKGTSSSDAITTLEREKSELQDEVLRLQSLQKPKEAVVAAASHGRQSRISWRPNPILHLRSEQSEVAAKRQIARTSATQPTAQQVAFETAKHL